MAKSNCKIKKITSLDHAEVKRYAKFLKDASFRKINGSLVIEGKKLVLEEIKRGRVKSLMSVNREFLEEAKIFPSFWITSEILKKITSTVTPEGVVAEVVYPSGQNLSHVKKLLVLDRISDPGNLGSLIRTAAGLNWDGVYLVEGSCDPFNDKALRASKGAALQMPLDSGSLETLLQLLEEGSFQVLAASFNGSKLLEIKLENKPLALIIGNESQGISKKLLDRFKKVTIPISSKVESLNAASAGAILMYGLMEGLDG